MTYRLLVLIITCLILVLSAIVSSSHAQRIITLVTIHGEKAWHSGCILGGSPAWRLVPHRGDIEIFTDLILGFDATHRPDTRNLPSVPGQGSIIEIAENEGWATAFFAPSDSVLHGLFSPIRDQAGSWNESTPGYRGWDELNERHGAWLATQHVDRFSWIHISLADLPPGGGGSAELYRFWLKLDEMLEALSEEWTLFVVFIPSESMTPWIRSSIPLASFRGTVDVPPENLVLSTLDIAPALAQTMGFLNTPDYYGQSLTLWKRIERRVEPVPILIDNTIGFQGTRIIAYQDPFEGDQTTHRIRFFDLWTGTFVSCNENAWECSRLAELLASTKEFNEHTQGSISTIQGAPEENSEQ